MLKRHRVPLRRLSLVLSALYGFGVASSALAARPPIDFKNPGGMWMPSQISLPEHQQALQRLGLQIPAQDLADPQSGLMQAIVSLDGCSGSFIS